jgi:type IV secretory pathway VirJ component
MTIRLVAVAISAALAVCGGFPKSSAETIDGASFGLTQVAAPVGAPLGFVAFFSDEAGWTDGDDRLLAEMAARGALAVGVDTKIYLQNLEANRNAVRKDDCVNFFQDIEDLSRRVQGRHPSPFYNKPVVAGVGEGGAIAYAALAQADVATLSTAISVDPTATVDVSRSLCRLDSFPSGSGGVHILGAVAKLNGDWQVAFDDAAEPRSRTSIEALARVGIPSRITFPRGAGSLGTLGVLVERSIETLAKQGVESLPLVELPAERPSRFMVVFISGDGGWRDLDKTLGEKLQAMGMSVVGWDSLRYFWSRKTPQQTSADLAAIMAYYAAKWSADKVALVGYSFGADVLPVIYNLLPAAYRDRVSMISLLALESGADWEIRVAGWFGARPSKAATSVAPELARIPGPLVQCYYGVEETDSECIDLGDKGIELIRTPGAHHFGHEYDRIAKDIFDGLRRRSQL